MTFESEVNKYAILSIEEEKQLVERMQQGDVSARNKLIKHNLRHVVSAASEIVYYKDLLPDAISIGCEEITKSAHKFNADMGYRFSTFVATCVRNAIRAKLPNVASVIRIPQEKRRLISKLNNAKNEFWERNGYEPDESTLASLTGISLDNVRSLLSMEMKREGLYKGEASQDNNIDTVYNGQEDINEQDDAMSDIFIGIADESGGKRSDIENVLNRALSTLPERDSKILRMYYGLDGVKSFTLKEIANEMNLSVEGVRKIVNRAITKIKNDSSLMNMLSECQKNT